MLIKKSFLLLVHKCGVVVNLLFIPTSMLSQNFPWAVSARNLGFTFDNNLNCRQHISYTCCCCFNHIRDLRRIRWYKYCAVVKTIATACVRSILDSCKHLYHNIAINYILKQLHSLLSPERQPGHLRSTFCCQC